MRTFYGAGDGPHHHCNVYGNLLSVHYNNRKMVDDGMQYYNIDGKTKKGMKKGM